MRFITILPLLIPLILSHDDQKVILGLQPVSNEELRIIFGSPTKRFAHPHQISLQVGKNDLWYHSCGGSIFNETRIITAAHCLLSGGKLRNPLKSLRIIAGGLNLGKYEPQWQLSKIDSIETHEEYSESQIRNDVAIITLSTPLNFTQDVQPIKLASQDTLEMIKSSQNKKNDIKKWTCTATGWGLTETGQYSRILREVDLDFVELKVCRDIYHETIKITEGMICFEKPTKGICTGDSGGPITCQNIKTNETELVGISSFTTRPCAHENYPSVFADVAFYRKWFDSKLQ